MKKTIHVVWLHISRYASNNIPPIMYPLHHVPHPNNKEKPCPPPRSSPETPREKANRYPSQPLPNRKGMLLLDNLEPLRLPPDGQLLLKMGPEKSPILNGTMIFHTSMFGLHMSFKRVYSVDIKYVVLLPYWLRIHTYIYIYIYIYTPLSVLNLWVCRL